MTTRISHLAILTLGFALMAPWVRQGLALAWEIGRAAGLLA
jgi:hypothetical protein